MTFRYSALSTNGEKVSGIVEAYNELDAVSRIKQTCSVVLKITPEADKGMGLMNMEIGGNKLNNKAFTLMCSQFAIILRSGIPIARTVELIAQKMTDKPLKKLLNAVAQDVEAGRSLSASFADHGDKLLPNTFMETLRAGEASGNLDKAFESMYRHYDKQVKMRAKVKSALSYPIFVLIIAIVVVIILMVKVVPTFIAIFDSYDAELPVITQILIAISNFFSNYILIITVVVAALVVAYKIYGNTEAGRLKIAQIKLKIPVLGNINVLNAASQFANTMTMMLKAGLTITHAISITAKVIDNYHISQEVGKLAGKIEEGHSLGDTIREIDCLPDILKDMTAVGEQTGELESTLETVSGYYDSELETATDAAMKKLEPTLLVGLAGIAGFIVIAIYMAMFSMYSAM